VLGGCRVGLLGGVLGWSVDPDGVGRSRIFGVPAVRSVRVSGAGLGQDGAPVGGFVVANPKCTSAGVWSPIPV